jgi:hypothetical protein
MYASQIRLSSSFETLSAAKTLILSCLLLQVTNNRTDRPTDLFVTLDRLSLASRHYRLEALPGQFSTSEQVGNVLQIGWQERITVHYRVIPLEEESKTCLLSECAFAENAECSIKECVASEATDYLCLERACETFEVRCRLAVIDPYLVEYNIVSQTHF